MTPEAPWTGSGWREYSYGGFGRGHPPTGCRRPECLYGADGFQRAYVTLIFRWPGFLVGVRSLAIAEQAGLVRSSPRMS